MKKEMSNTKLIFSVAIILLICMVSVNMGIDNATGKVFWRSSRSSFLSRLRFWRRVPTIRRPPIRPPVTATCYDSDGDNPNKLGYVKLGNKKELDFCSTSGRRERDESRFKVSSCTGGRCYVNEYICYNNRITSKKVKCDNGCSNGVCLEEIQSTCPSGFILDNEDESFITNAPICKPKIMNLVASDNINDYLSGKLAGIERMWDGWKNYQPLVKKVNELTIGKTDDYEKVLAIANWVRKSKEFGCQDVYDPFCPSPANDGKDFSVIFNSDKGVCLDAAIITSAMLRVAGIPAIPKMVGPGHIVVIYYLDNLWYAVDPTFCVNKNNCRDVELESPEKAKEKIYFLYNRMGHFNKEGVWGVEGEYCEYGFCMDHPFQTWKIMPLNDKSVQATVVYPAILRVRVNGEQVSCSLEFKNMVCGGSCFFMYINKWFTQTKIQYEIEDVRIIGYNKIILPAKLKLEDAEPEDTEKKTINYRYACRKGHVDQELIAYKEFTLKPNDKLVITYNDLQKPTDATIDDFNKIKNVIKSITVDMNIRPI